ncbi:hypothetical protein V6N13_043585 [Hibiscus sabdariffa]|uniref:Uncharacterized protein n=1 Tax=Hibiscus sabdariffa TaxID=183260 RepID=A0ABR2RFK7_9ROSI
MFDFGDEVRIESYRIPWLIWIQILVLLLLTILLYGFTLLVLDLPETSSSSSSSVSSRTTTLASQVVEKEKQSMKGEIGISRGACRRLVSGEMEGQGQGQGCSNKEPNENGCHHPCHYFRLAKLAFLKCLGLDFLCSDNASITEQR